MYVSAYIISRWPSGQPKFRINAGGAVAAVAFRVINPDDK
jgi:hypothetical protein